MKTEAMTFEEAMQRLEEIVDQMQRSDATLEESLQLYTEGTKLAKYCKDRLKKAQLTIEKLTPDAMLEDEKDGE